MKKKGIVSKVIIFWALGILVLFLVIYIIAGPEKLLAKTRDAAFSFGLGALPEERAEEFIGASPLALDMKQYFDYLAKELPIFVGDYGDKEHCFITLDKFEARGSYNIVLSPGRVEIAKSGQGMAASGVTEYSKEISGFIPCMVYGDSAEVFYNNRILGGSKTSAEYNPATTTLLLKSKDELEINGVEHKVLRDPDNDVYLYKADKTHFCFLSRRDDNNCKVKNGKIAKGCLNKLTYFIPVCGEEAKAIGEFSSTCNRICGSKECIIGENDDKTKSCNVEFDFDRNDDKCVCGSVTRTKIPLPYSEPPTCDEICQNDGKVCMVAIDNGKPKECDQGDIRFEGRDDFCVCGDASKKIDPPDDPDPRKQLFDNCKTICGNRKMGCIMGLDDGKDPRRCDEGFIFERNQNYDYCFCRGEDGSEEVIPGYQEGEKSCNNICENFEALGMGCIIGIEDGKDTKKCDELLEFDNKNNDYCICSHASEKIVPLPYPDDNPNCNEVCGGRNKCGKGMDSGSVKLCSKEITFEKSNDYCVCGDFETIIPFRG